MTSILVAYIPVLHQGYLDLLSRHPQVTEVAVLGRSLTEPHRSLQRDLRAIAPELVVTALLATDQVASARVIEAEDLAGLTAYDEVIMPRDDVSTAIQALVPQASITYDDAFLRWDHSRTVAVKAVTPDRITTAREFGTVLTDTVMAEAARSQDWWRQVAACLLRDQQIIFLDHNRHLPQESQIAIAGDPRSNFKGGQALELSTAMHAEVAVIGAAAARGIRVKGLELLVTTFPCPPCAKLIGQSGIRTCYYMDAYSLLDGEAILRHFGTELVQIVI